MIVMLISLAIVGLIVGGLARLALPGPDPMGIPATIGLGIAGSFVGGLITYAIFGRVGGIIVSVLAATAILALYRKYVQHRPLTGPGARRIPPST
jgi:uncharacterized membrane protein YeaQ/YmgE (transglycosylase-associated protein family)